MTPARNEWSEINFVERRVSISQASRATSPGSKKWPSGRSYLSASSVGNHADTQLGALNCQLVRDGSVIKPVLKPQIAATSLL